jgi:hypothetical protein
MALAEKKELDGNGENHVYPKPEGLVSLIIIIIIIRKGYLPNKSHNRV